MNVGRKKDKMFLSVMDYLGEKIRIYQISKGYTGEQVEEFLAKRDLNESNCFYMVTENNPLEGFKDAK